MNYCATCGERLVPGASYCAKCGLRAAASTPAPAKTSRPAEVGVIGWVLIGLIVVVGAYVLSTGYVGEDAIGIVSVYLILAGLVALLARSQGRSPLTWFLLAALLSPLLAFLAAVLTPSPRDKQTA